MTATKTDKYFAAIDLGTNSCRLVIADQNGRYVYTDALSPRLGEGLHQNMCFTPEALERGIDAFCDFKRVMGGYDIADCRAIATASCRMAKNAQELLDNVYHKTSIKIDVIDGYEEARLNLKGALEHVCGQTQYVVLYDLGGGSTEITLATNEKNPKIIHTVSIPWGARNASEAFALSEYDAERAEKLEKEISSYVKKFAEDAHLEKYKGDICYVATSSTPLRYVSMIKKFGKYDRNLSDGRKIATSDIDRQIERIFGLTVKEMEEDAYIGPKRASIFVAACVIFKTIYDGLGMDAITASLRSAKDGIIEELIEEYKNGKTD